MSRQPPDRSVPTGTAAPGVRGPRSFSGAHGGPHTRPPLAPCWKLRGRALDLEAPVVMGILNVTPDSFSDGGQLPTAEAVVERGGAMVAAGAGILDVGGESTRPGAVDVPLQEELDRVIPVLEALAARLDVALSVDTRKAEVARQALAAGAHVVNDVSALAHDPDMAGVVAAEGAGLVLMHMRGNPATMQSHTAYGDVSAEVSTELAGAVETAVQAGIRRHHIVVDPGIGFAKTAEQNLVLLNDLGRLGRLGLPVLVGPSRKSFLGALLEVPPPERVAGTVAACVLAWLEGARIFRVHDVAPVVQALAVARAVRRAGPGRQP